MVAIIIKGRSKMPRTRSEHHRIMAAEGWGGAGLTDEQADKCRYLERKHGKAFYRQKDIDRVK